MSAASTSCWPTAARRIRAAAGRRMGRAAMPATSLWKAELYRTVRDDRPPGNATRSCAAFRASCGASAATTSMFFVGESSGRADDVRAASTARRQRRHAGGHHRGGTELVPKPKRPWPARAAVRHARRGPGCAGACAWKCSRRPSRLMDHLLLELAANNLALRDTMKAIHGQPQAVLMVEFSGDDRRPRSPTASNGCSADSQASPASSAAVPALDAALREPLWNLRTRRDAAAVRHARRPQAGHVRRRHRRRHRALAGVRRRASARFCSSHGTDGAFYGHASVGCLHIRPGAEPQGTPATWPACAASRRT